MYEAAKAAAFIGDGVPLVPSRGWTGVLRSVADTAQFQLLGPFFPGQYIVTLEWTTRTNGNSTIHVGAVITTSDNASLDAWQSGSPIVERSSETGDGQPVWAFGQGNNNLKIFRMAVGRAIRDGPHYVVFRVLVAGGAQVADVMCSAICMELVPEPT